VVVCRFSKRSVVFGVAWRRVSEVSGNGRALPSSGQDSGSSRRVRFLSAYRLSVLDDW